MSLISGPSLSSSQSVTIARSCQNFDDSELECLVNSDNNNISEISKSDPNSCHQERCGRAGQLPCCPDTESDDEDAQLLLQHPARGGGGGGQDDSGCATSLEILSVSCRTPVTGLPSLSSLSLARDDLHSLARYDLSDLAREETS